MNEIMIQTEEEKPKAKVSEYKAPSTPKEPSEDEYSCEFEAKSDFVK